MSSNKTVTSEEDLKSELSSAGNIYCKLRKQQTFSTKTERETSASREN